MKKLSFCVGLLLAPMVPLSAQVTVEVTMEQEQFLPSEAVSVAVRITNHSGQTLHLGAEADWLAFSVEAKDGFIVPKLEEVPVAGEFKLESSKVATKRVNLGPAFMLTKPGRYTVSATVYIKDWARAIPSKQKSFDIVHGARLWEQEFGVPQAAGEPEVRKYALQQANYQKRLMLYARVTDASESRTFRVIPIGPMVSFSNPEPQVDRQSNLHIFYQSGARSFSYCVLNPDGELIVRQTHEHSNTRPRLQLDRHGNHVVVGGVRRNLPSDVPPSDSARQK